MGWASLYIGNSDDESMEDPAADGDAADGNTAEGDKADTADRKVDMNGL